MSNITTKQCISKKGVFCVKPEDIKKETCGGIYITLPQEFCEQKEILYGEYLENEENYEILFEEEIIDEEIIDEEIIEEEILDEDDWAIFVSVIQKRGQIFLKNGEYEINNSPYFVGKKRIKEQIIFFTTEEVIGIYDDRIHQWILPPSREMYGEKILDYDNRGFMNKKFHFRKEWVETTLRIQMLWESYNIKVIGKRGRRIPHKGILNSLRGKEVSDVYLDMVDDRKNHLLKNEDEKTQTLLVTEELKDIKYILKNKERAPCSLEELLWALMDAKEHPNFSYKLNVAKILELGNCEVPNNFEIEQKIKTHEVIDGFLFKSPKDFYEVLKEGNNQHNCLDSYGGLLSRKETNIFFMRDIEFPEKSLVTIELDNKGKLIQAYQACNKEITPEQEKVIEKWKKTLLY